VDEVKQEKATSLLEERHIQKIFKAYRTYRNISGFARVVETQCIASQNYTLSIPIYVSRNETKQDDAVSLQSVICQWEGSTESLQQSLKELVKTLEGKK
jgi:type I restriction enzyme M protein